MSDTNLECKTKNIEIIEALSTDRPQIKAALFDFDGTISTLRHGWEGIMEPLMLEMIAGDTAIDEALIQEVREYIDQSTGIQTYYQMKWLAETVKKYGKNKGASEDPWWYKAEYNRRLMEPVEKRIKTILDSEKSPEDYMIKGSREFLQALVDEGIEIYVASGTDHPDVNNEAGILGLKKYFKVIAGAPLGKADCSKEAVLRKLVADNGLQGAEVAVFGDGKVEIALGREVGAIALGLASDEDKRFGVNEVKRARLIKAGAHAITGDFINVDEMMCWLGLK
jgi:phosphoglycolate phosphatase-like HAD superfamily hydrolase